MQSKSRVKIFYTLFVSIICLSSFNSFVEAACGGANCSVITGSQEGLVGKDRFVFDVSYRYILQEDKTRGSGNTGEVLVPKINFEAKKIEQDHHRELRTINKLAQLDVGYGVSDKLTLTLNIPFLNDRLHEHDDEVTPATPAGTFTNQDGTTGFGDVTVSAKYALWQTTKHLFIGGVGVKFPTGEYKLRDSGGSINEPTLMPGTGSYDAILSGLYNYSLIPNRLSIFTSLSHRFTTENDLDYIMGDTTLFDVGVSYVLTDKVSISGQVNTRITGEDEYINVDVQSTGGEFIFFTPGIRLVASENISVYSHVQIPIYQRVNDDNVVVNYGILLGLSYGF